ncbi:MAG TPA: bifunctional RNase H/acid phosphatase [Streptosporangiaceae bacterium]|jgi:probable phosphoglycerate mutase|nr:bifunctional RNase H/acid phosphatase [Streptosporangiaceae bacterium]
MRRLIVEADGGSRGNPGPAGYGAVVRDADTGEVLAEVLESIGIASNNVAEYSGLIAGLRAAAQIDPHASVQVRMDSRLVVEQMSGRWRIKHPDMRPLALTASETARSFSKITYTWIPRERNKHADRLANEAMDAAERGGGGTRRNMTPRRPAETTAPSPGPGGQSGTGAPPETSAPAGSGTVHDAPAPAGSPAARATHAPGTGWMPAQGQPTTTLLLRHGQTPLSAERRFAGTGDIELTEAGVGQAKLAAERLAAHGGIDVILTSPLRRARQTAAEVAAATGAKVVADEGFRETDFGAWEGLTFAEARQRWPGEVAAWLADPAAAPPGGESFAAVNTRVKAALARLLAAYERQTVLVVSHVTPIKTLLTMALLAPPAAMYRMHLDVGALSEIDWYADGPAVVRSLNDTAHLR